MALAVSLASPRPAFYLASLRTWAASLAMAGVCQVGIIYPTLPWGPDLERCVYSVQMDPLRHLGQLVDLLGKQG